MKYCSSAGEVPNQEHYAVVQFESTYVEGDQRSRDCPGHGYPAHYVSHAKYIAFTDKDEWEDFVKKEYASNLKYGGSKFVAFKVDKPVSLSVSVDIK